MEELRAENIVTKGNISFDKNFPIGRINLPNVFLGTFNDKKVAVKRIRAEYQHLETSEDLLKRLEGNQYIVQLYGVAFDDNFRYYALELCDGSMNQLFLPDKAEYKGQPILSSMMPPPEEIMLELARGLEYIHSEKIVHRDIKPHNVLFKIIAQEEGKVVMTMKWADFGLSKPVSATGHFSLSVTEIGTLCWVAPEILESDTTSSSSNKISFKSDIWSTGCVFFYYLTEGKHPFGDVKHFTKLQTNVTRGNPVNMNPPPSDDWAFEMIKKMVEKVPKSRIELNEIINTCSKAKDSQISIERKIRVQNRQFKIGCTTYRNTMSQPKDEFEVEILRGIFGDKTVAVKRIPEYNWKESGEKNLRILEHHENVLRFLHADFHDYADVRYFAFELCAGSLDQLFLPENNPKRYKGPLLPPAYQVITSLIRGLNHIHSKGLVHGRIKPENVLISLTQPVTMKWADFGLIDLKIGMVYEHRISNHGSIGDELCWIAPEIIKEMDEYEYSSSLSYFLTSKADTWSAGAVFYYYLTKGKHHHYTKDLRAFSSCKQLPIDVSDSVFDDESLFARDIIAQMMAANPEERVKLVPDAIDQLETSWKSCKAFKESEILKLCSLSEPIEGDVNRLCELFNVEGINLNCSSDEGVTPLSLLCSSLEESKEHGRSLETLLQIMCERKIQPKGLLDKNSDGFNIIHRLCRKYEADNLQKIIRFIGDADRDALWIKDSDWYDYPLHLLCKHFIDYERQEKLADIIRSFVDSGFDIHAEDSDGNNTIHVLCKYQPRCVIETIKMLLDIGVLENLNAKNHFEESYLHKICNADQYPNLEDAIPYFVSHGADLNARDSSGNTILHRSCFKGWDETLLKIINLLKREKVDLSVINRNGYTALHLVCINYRSDYMLVDIIQELINDIDLNAKTEEGSTALYYLCEYCGNDYDLFNVIKLFIDSGRVDDINTFDINRKTILHHLCEKYRNSNLVNVVQLLIEKGIDINWKDSNGDTAVQHLVQKYPHSDVMNQIIQLFIDNGCESAQVCQQDLLKDSEIQNHSEYHPNYHFIVKRQRLESRNDQIIEEIIKRFNKPNACAKSSLVSNVTIAKPILTYLCELYGEELIKECIKWKYNFTASKVHHLCKFYKRENLLDILKAVIVEGGVHVHAKGEDGNTFLHLVCKYYDGDNIIDIVEMLVNDCGADPNARNDHRRTPLYYICYCCRKIEDISIAGIIRRFIEIGADPKIKDQYEMTTLHALCQSYKGANISDIVKLLIENGVDLNARTTSGGTALGYLCENYPHEEELSRPSSFSWTRDSI